MPPDPPVSPIATIKPRRHVADVPCPRPGCKGVIKMTVGDKGAAWGTCKEPTQHVGKNGRANVCGTPVSFTVPQTRALLEGKPDAEKVAAAAPPSPAAKPAASSPRRVAADRPKRPVADAGAGDGKRRDDPPRTAAKRRVGFFEY